MRKKKKKEKVEGKQKGKCLNKIVFTPIFASRQLGVEFYDIYKDYFLVSDISGFFAFRLSTNDFINDGDFTKEFLLFSSRDKFLRLDKTKINLYFNKANTQQP